MIIIIVNALNFKQKKKGNRLHITIVYTREIENNQTNKLLSWPKKKKAQKSNNQIGLTIVIYA